MSPLDLSGIELAAVVVAGFVAGFVNTVAGGGSLLTLPVLMLAGLPPTVANGTNRVAILMQSSVATARFDRAGALSRRQALGLIPPTLIGAGLGAYGASVMSDAHLEPIILTVLIVIAAIFALRPGWVTPTDDGAEVAASSEGPLVWAGLFAAGLYGGFLQAGVGFVLLTVLAGTLRVDLARANALKVALVVPYTVLALGIFALADQVSWAIGALLGVSSIAGAWLGVRVAMTHTAWLRWLVLGAVIACTVVTGLRRLS